MDRLTPWRIKSSLRHKVVLLQLLPYTQYSVKVTAHTDRGPGQTSSSVIGRTKSGSECQVTLQTFTVKDFPSN